MPRAINAFFWVAVWVAIAIQYDAFGNSSRLMGEAIIPAILGFVIDSGLRRRQRRPNSN
jgi:hypothetical protein